LKVRKNKRRNPSKKPKRNPSKKPKGKSGIRPKGKSGIRPKGKSGIKPKGKSGKKIGGKSGIKPKGKPGKKIGGKSGIKPKGKPGKANKMKYRKKKTLKFMKGKYSFNLKTGREFCSTKCSNNKSSNEGVCFKNGIKKCKSCSFTGNKTAPKGKESEALCKIVCRSINNKKCDFYAYIDNKKKVINKKLLNKFGRIFVMKFLQKNR